eukprot:CAMPEP_0206452900 /NCGR_PEP_ID=MMETSP0324_2-20121206/20217_1 /ASSEMBLY_ACC=CAM_ASM_000836 /TAXON_ID=2866 /ORGANISM="Crypthecodinium cohnii, Strain Seligo" /LENGTH=609 /DNA_ID=CAMNT_0053923071 /DNA_START=163 /DNA_END=1992 /DNA_ORIENTATION=+
MPVIEELDEDGNVIGAEEDEEEEEDTPEKVEQRRLWKKKCEQMAAEEKDRVAKQFELGEEHKLQGNECLAKGDFAGACKAYEEALQDLTLVGNEPENRKKAELANLALHLNMALAKLKMKQYDEVKYHCSSALLTDPKNAKALFRRGSAQAALAREATLFQEAEAKAALSDFAAILEEDPANAEALRESNRLKAELRAHEKDLARKQRETWGQVFGGKTVIEGEEDEGPPPPPPLIRPCKNTDKHLVAGGVGVSIADQQGSTLLTDVTLEFREGWAVGLISDDSTLRDRFWKTMVGKVPPAAGEFTVHPKPQKSGRKKDPKPIDSNIMLGAAVALTAIMAATELTPGIPAIQQWVVRFLVLCMGYLLYQGVKYNQDLKAPLSIHFAVASKENASVAALGAQTVVEDLLGGLLARQLSPTERHERVVTLLEAAGYKGLHEGSSKRRPAEKYERRRIKDLPEDQRRIVQALVCIAQRPEVIVMDCALEGLELEIQARLLKMMKRMKQECKTVVLCMSDDINQVVYLSDTLIIVDASGKCFGEKGPTQELLERPRSPLTEAHIGKALEPRVPSAGDGKATKRKVVGEELADECAELLGNATLEGAWIPPKYT